MYALVELVRNMTSRSMPMPHPPVGGRQCSRLFRGCSARRARDNAGKKEKHSRVNERLVDVLSLVVALILLPHLWQIKVK